ncbi:MAG TPA: hypothetical protein VGL58_10775 [Caulobacteraceae bacterium]|jgi:hypothetical protein
MSLLLYGIGALALAACSPNGAQVGNAAPAAAASDEPDYLSPPELASASSVDGRLQLSGLAAPGAAVRLASPGGAALFATADAAGHWSLPLPLSPDARLFNLSMSNAGRVIQARGYLFVAPDGAAARLRAGGGTELLAASGGLAPLALDYDKQRAVTLSGRAGPGEDVSLHVDGVERGEAVADPDGRFVLSFNQPITPGPHTFDLVGATAETKFIAPIAPPAPLSGTPFAAAKSAGGWRVDWLTPGGGEQVTLLFARAAA